MNKFTKYKIGLKQVQLKYFKVCSMSDEIIVSFEPWSCCSSVLIICLVLTRDLSQHDTKTKPNQTKPLTKFSLHQTWPIQNWTELRQNTMLKRNKKYKKLEQRLTLLNSVVAYKNFQGGCSGSAARSAQKMLSPSFEKSHHKGF